MKKSLSILILAFALLMTACTGKTGTSESANGNTPTPAPTTAETPTPAPADTPAAEEELKPEDGAKLIIWEGNDQLAFLEELTKEFTAKYNIPVEIQDSAPTDQMAKMKTDGPAGLGADVLVLPHDHLGEAVASGIIVPNDFYEEDTRANFAQAAVDAVTMDGILYGYPRNLETYLLYYNKSLVSEDVLTSWDKITEFAKGYNDAANNKFGVMWEVGNWYYAYSFIAGNGGYVFGKGGTDPADIGLNTPETIEAMQFYQTLRDALPIKAPDASGDVKTELFQSGKLPINMDGIWQLGNFTQEKLGFEVGAAPLPAMSNGKKPVSFAGVKAYFVSSASKYPNAAKLLIHFLTSQDAMSKDYKLSGILPARNGMENDPEIQKDPRAQAFLEQFKSSQAMPAILEMRSVWTPATASLEPIWNGEDVKTIMDKTVADIKIGIEQGQ